ncbi:MAG: dUTP diphosphatase [Halieaceae bacterium]|nr:dUTP diphosphatase [Halieaceae bacterium]
MSIPRHSLITMLGMQHRMNMRVHPEWEAQGFAWYRAIWIEAGELIDHYGYKWWKKQAPDMAQVQLEVIDIWHFGMSALLAPRLSAGDTVEAVADEILAILQQHKVQHEDVREATEALALHSLESRSFCPGRFQDLMTAAALDYDALFRAYVGKNVLNFFRQDHGYQEGHYQKVWAGREDNEHLTEIAAGLDSEAPDYAEALYAALANRYPGASS